MFDLRRLLAAFCVIASVISVPHMASAETVVLEDGTSIEKFEKWLGRCNAGPDGKDVCSVAFEIRSEQSQGIVLFFGIFKDPAQGYYTLVNVPLGTVLPRGIGLSVDGAELKKLVFQFCLPRGCQSATPFSAADIQKLKSGNELSVSIADIRQGPVSLNISLAGVTAAMNWLDSKHPG